MKWYRSACYSVVTVAALLGSLIEAHAAGPGRNPAVAGRPGGLLRVLRLGRQGFVLRQPVRLEPVRQRRLDTGDR